MTDSLGLSIGMTNLVAARFGRDPVMRRSILTVFDDRPAEVGLAAENPPRSSPGMVLSGFVDRVGDPVPLVAADGSAHRGEQVLAEALDTMARTAGGGAPVAIAVPAHWGPATVGALRGALRNHPGLASDGAPAALIPDSVAALAALQAAPGLPDAGVVVLCDFGGSGTSITLADASSNLDAVGQTVRHTDFSGDGVDQLLLNHVISGIADANDADPAGTAAVGSLARLRDACRQAKERLSADTATVVPAELPGVRTDFRVTRAELEQLIAGGLAGVLAAVEDTLRRNNIAPADVSAVATVGGGAHIPLVTQQLSERLRAPVVTTPQSQLNIAAGAALVAGRGLSAEAPTGMAPIAPDAPTGMAPIAPDAPTGLAPAADAPTGMAPAAWVAGAAGLAAGESASDGASSATFRALAWSQDDAPTDEPVPYAGEDYTVDAGTGAARPPIAFAPGGEEAQYPPEPEPLPWYKRPPILFGAAAVAALAAISGLAVTLTSTTGDSSPVTETSTTYSMEPSFAPLPPPVTTVTVGPDGRATTTVSQPPPPPPPPPSSTTTTSPTTTTQPTTTTTTTTTTQPTTTTTRPTTTQPTTTAPPPPTTTVVPDPPDPPDPPEPPTTVIVPGDGA
ncbi:Hsp70 family protein [Mycobacterium manitobense]|uniref:Hsp70 family protein n=1 Tax=[Mycobacterium] manitobense TaxID=190147 RepID=A0A9X3C0W4_9MYCO|nr:Hsp70 family protein [[Mycobacterium] manitobense]MCV7174047.1 Hsp70 family protein [[Mycobacterium] manitobense]